MANNITGVGVAGFRDPVNNKMFLTPATTVTVNEEKSVEVVQAYSMTGCSPLLDQDAAEKSSSFTITLGTGILDEESWAWIVFNNRRQTAATIDLPTIGSGIVTGGAVAVPALALDQADVSAIILDSTIPGNVCLTWQASGTGVTPVTFEIAAGQIVVDPIYNGKTLSFYYRTNQTNIEMIGGNTPYSNYESIEMFVKFCGTRFAPKRLWFPKVSSITGVNLDASADSFSREYRAFLPEGWTVPYALFDA